MRAAAARCRSARRRARWCRIRAGKLDERGTGHLRGEWRPELLGVLLLGLPGARCVGPNGRPAEIGERREARQHRGEGDTEPAAPAADELGLMAAPVRLTAMTLDPA